MNNRTEVMEHAEAFLLLPWYANSTLRPDERTIVKAHVELCPICQKELAFIYNVTEATDTQGDVSTIPQNGLASVLQQIEQAAAKETGNRGRIEGFIAFLRRSLLVQSYWQTKLVAALPAIALVVVATYMLWPPASINDPVYQTLSSESGVDTTPLKFKIMVSDNTDEQQIRRILSSVNTQITVSKLNKTNYILEMPANDPREALTLLEVLRANHAVRTAELLLDSSSHQRE